MSKRASKSFFCIFIWVLSCGPEVQPAHEKNTEDSDIIKRDFSDWLKAVAKREDIRKALSVTYQELSKGPVDKIGDIFESLSKDELAAEQLFFIAKGILCDVNGDADQLDFEKLEDMFFQLGPKVILILKSDLIKAMQNLSQLGEELALPVSVQNFVYSLHARGRQQDICAVSDLSRKKPFLRAIALLFEKPKDVNQSRAIVYLLDLVKRQIEEATIFKK